MQNILHIKAECNTDVQRFLHVKDALASARLTIEKDSPVDPGTVT
jgi:hypothetical protein